MRFWLILAVLMTFAGAAQAATVYELFTARDCPSCPRADEIFSQLARTRPDIITLACHVTYFDRPGRSDALSAPFCDGRQTGYKQAGVVPKIFTPAAIVNGAQAVKGNDADSVMAGLQTVDPISNIYLSARGGYLNITMPDVRLTQPADVWLFAYDSRHTVRYLAKLLRWNGKGVAMAFPITDVPAAGYAVVAQSARQTDIVAAGKTN